MSTVTDIAQHLLRLDPQKNVARLSFYHFLKNHRNLQTPFSAGVVDQFYRRALYFQFWHSQKEMLGRTVEEDLRSYPGFTDLDLGGVVHAHRLQVVLLEHFHDLEGVLEKSALPAKTGERVRFIRLSDQRAMRLKMDARGGLTVSLFPNVALIRKGELEPLAPVAQLHYNAGLELEPEQEQMLEVSPMMTAHFQIAGQSCEGHFLRGYTFQRQDAFKGPVTQSQELFFALKSTERHFINPQTDPFYQELVSLLEHASHILKTNHPEALTVGFNALKRGRLAIKSIFPNDKLLHLLVTNLEYLVNGKSGEEKEECPKLSPLA